MSQNTQIFFRYGRESLLALLVAHICQSVSAVQRRRNDLQQQLSLVVNHTFGSNLLSVTKASFFRDDEAQQYNTALQETPTLYLQRNVGLGDHQRPVVQFPGFFDFNDCHRRSPVRRAAEYASDWGGLFLDPRQTQHEVWRTIQLYSVGSRIWRLRSGQRSFGKSTGPMVWTI